MPRRRGNGQGSVTPRKDGRWAASIMIDGRRYTWTTHTKKEGQARIDEIKQSVAQGILPSNQTQTVEDLLCFWLKEIVIHKRPATILAYEQRTRRYLIPTVGKIPLQRLTPQHVIKMQNDLLRSGVSPHNVQYTRIILSMALKQAVFWRLTPYNAASGVKPPEVEEKEYYTPTADDIRVLLATAGGRMIGTLVLTATLLGLRSSEIRGLRWQDLDFEKKGAEIRTALRAGPVEPPVFVPLKTKTSKRDIPLDPWLIEELRDYRARQLRQRAKHADVWKHYDLVFCNPDGTALSQGRTLLAFQKLCAEAGLPVMRLHALRHACASLMASQGVSIRTTADLLGHKDLRTTHKVYTHAYEENKRDAVAGLADLLRDAS